jgi:hypothetical protein
MWNGQSPGLDTTNVDMLGGITKDNIATGLDSTLPELREPNLVLKDSSLPQSQYYCL